MCTVFVVLLETSEHNVDGSVAPDDEGWLYEVPVNEEKLDKIPPPPYFQALRILFTTTVIPFAQWT